jgi:hypothetical protein
MIFNFRFKNPYKTVGDNTIYEVKSSGLNLGEAYGNACVLVSGCEFITNETRLAMLKDLANINPIVTDAIFIMG